jgi:hypothetical protein
MTEFEYITGSLSVSLTAHEFLTSIVKKDEEVMEDRPFTTIVDAFKFAFSIGLINEKYLTFEGETMTIATRQFSTAEYIDVFKEKIESTGKSLGGLISGYAEGGISIMMKHTTDGDTLLSMLN